MENEHLLALGRAVYTFQRLEWLTIWLNTLLSEDGNIDRFDRLAFGQLVQALKARLDSDPVVGYPVRDAALNWVGSLRAVNTLRQDVFHSYPAQPDRVLRLRPSGLIIPIHTRRLEAAEHRFGKAIEEGIKLFNILWPDELGEPKFSIG